MSAAQFRELLESADVAGLRRYWREAMPEMPQPKNDLEAETMMHMARTEAISISFRRRAYSHQWLTERNLPSLLPDDLRPKAEQIFPVVKESVGISVNYSMGFMKPAADIVRGAMENAVLDCYAERRTESTFVRARMMEAKEREQKALFGAIDRALARRQ